MDTLIKNQYQECFDIVYKNTSVKKKNKNISVDKSKEKLWSEMCPAYYLISMENQEVFFEKEAEKLGFANLITYINPNEEFLVKNIFNNRSDMKELEKWVTEVNINQGKNLGCHFSHVIIAKDMIKNNHSHAMVFEEDCKFKSDLTIDFIKNFSSFVRDNIKNFFFLNLGAEHTEKVTLQNFNVEKRSSSLTHSYIMNLDCAKKLVNSIDFSVKKPNSINGFFNQEQFYRGGADDFFYGYIESYVFNPSLTYQQFTGNNIERKT